MVEVNLDTLDPKDDEKESTAALVRGMAAQAAQKGYSVAGFDVYATSSVLPGSGLSSSAACEVLLGVIENHLFCRDELDPVTIAQMGQKAENVYFGKPLRPDGSDRVLGRRRCYDRLCRSCRSGCPCAEGRFGQPWLCPVHHRLRRRPR